MLDAQPAPSLGRMVNVEAYHHCGPRPPPLPNVAGPAAGLRGSRNENEHTGFGPIS